MKPTTVHHCLWTGVLALGMALGLTACAPRYYPPPPPRPPRAPAPPPPQAVRPVFYIKANRLNLRMGPGMDFPKISVLDRGEEVEKVGASEDWFQIRVIRDGSLGWVDSKYLSSTPLPQGPEAAPAPPAHGPAGDDGAAAAAREDPAAAAAGRADAPDQAARGGKAAQTRQTGGGSGPAGQEEAGGGQTGQTGQTRARSHRTGPQTGKTGQEGTKAGAQGREARPQAGAGPRVRRQNQDHVRAVASSQ